MPSWHFPSDPRGGRFLRDDPLGFAAGQMNLQILTGNDPVNYTDPSGMDGIQVTGTTVSWESGFGDSDGDNVSVVIGGVQDGMLTVPASFSDTGQEYQVSLNEVEQGINNKPWGFFQGHLQSLSREERKREIIRTLAEARRNEQKRLRDGLIENFRKTNLSWILTECTGGPYKLPKNNALDMQNEELRELNPKEFDNRHAPPDAEFYDNVKEVPVMGSVLRILVGDAIRPGESSQGVRQATAEIIAAGAGVAIPLAVNNLDDIARLLQISRGSFDKILKSQKSLAKLANTRILDQSKLKSYATFDALKRENKNKTINGVEQVWHHIVEKCQGQDTRSNFNKYLIHSSVNVIEVSPEVNQRLADYYNSIDAFTNGQRVRDWLNGQSFEVQHEFGVKMLNQALNGRLPHEL